MCLYILVTFLHTGILILHGFFTNLLKKSKGTLFDTLKDTITVVFYVSQALAQVILIYLWIQFSAPFSLAKDIETETEDNYEEEFDEIRDPNIDMFFYVKSLNKRQRLQNTASDALMSD